MGNTEFVIEPGQQDIVIKRTFDAPRDVVFKALTDPELIPAWWGPRKYETVVDTMEVRPGGRWRFINRDGETGHGFHGVYHDVVPRERVVQTFEFEGAPGNVALETLVMTDVDGKTQIVTQSLYQSVEARDAVVQSGMEEGARETYDRLDELIQSLR